MGQQPMNEHEARERVKERERERERGGWCCAIMLTSRAMIGLIDLIDLDSKLWLVSTIAPSEAD
jgi:hypothetical protein